MPRSKILFLVRKRGHKTVQGIINLDLRSYLEEITMLNVYVPNSRASKYMKKLIELKGKTDKSIVVIEDFSTSLSTIDKTRRKPTRIQKI